MAIVAAIAALALFFLLGSILGLFGSGSSTRGRLCGTQDFTHSESCQGGMVETGIDAACGSIRGWIYVDGVEQDSLPVTSIGDNAQHFMMSAPYPRDGESHSIRYVWEYYGPDGEVEDQFSIDWSHLIQPCGAPQSSSSRETPAPDPADGPTADAGSPAQTIVAIDLELSTNGHDADEAPGPYIPVGGWIVWRYEVMNTGNVPFTSVEVTDSRGAAVTCPGSSLAAGASMTCTANAIAWAGPYANTGTATGIAATGSAADSDPSHFFGVAAGIDIEVSTNGEDADTVPGPYILAGEAVAWQYLVTNTGNKPMSSIVVTDDRGVVVTCPQSGLSAGASMTCSGSGVAGAGQYANAGAVVGMTLVGAVVDSDPSHYFGAVPGIGIEVSTNGQDADAPPGPYILAGETVNWTYVVENPGNVPLSDVAVTDDQGVAISCPGSDLAPGAGMTCTASGAAGAGQYENIGTATGMSVVGSITDSDPSHYFGAQPGIDIEVSTNGEDADASPGPYILAGETVNWTYVVENTGNVPLSDVAVTDDQGVAVSCPGSDLTAGAGMTCTASGTAGAGQYENIGTATGMSVVGSITESDPSHYFGALPGVDIEVSTNGVDADAAPGPYILVGDVLDWEYRVENTGNVWLSNVEVTDDQGVTVACPDNDIAPGASMTCTASGAAVSGQYANLGTVTGSTVVGPLTDSDPSHYFGAYPPPTLGKVFAPASIPLNTVTTLTFTLSNTDPAAGDLTGITFTDTLPPGLKVADTPNASTTCSGSPTWAPADGDATLTFGSPAGATMAAGTTCIAQVDVLATSAGQLINVSGNISSTESGENTGPDGYAEASLIAVAPPTLSMHFDPSSIQTGDATVLSFMITNPNTHLSSTLSNIAFTDELPEGLDAVETPMSWVCGPASMLWGVTTLSLSGASLPPGSTCTFPVVVVHSGIGGTMVNTTSNITSDEGGIGNSASSILLVDAPGIDIQVSTNGHDADLEPGPNAIVGDTVIWTFEVMNTGEAPLSNVVVSADPYSPVGCSASSLPVASIMQCMLSGQVEPGQFEIVGTVTATTAVGPVADSDPSHYFGVDADVDIEVHTNGVDADAAPGLYLAPGSAVTWTYIVMNTGNAALSDIVVADSRGVPVNCPGSSLAPGDSMTCTASGVAGSGQYENFGTVNATSIAGTLDDSDASHYFGAAPGIDIEVATNGYDADTAPGPYLTPGSAVTWTYVVQNTGNMPLSSVAVTDNQGNIVTCPKTGLSVGETMTCMAIGAVASGQYANTGTVTAATAVGPMTDSDPSHYFGAAPNIDIEKFTNGRDADNPPSWLDPSAYIWTGELVLWEYVVQNTGNMPLTSVAVTDNQGHTVTCPKTGLSVGETMTCTASGVAGIGPYGNLGTVTAMSPIGPVTDSDPSHYIGVENTAPEDWELICGWYVSQYEQGLIGYDDIPAWCLPLP